MPKVIENKEFSKELKKRTRRFAVRIIRLSTKLPNTPEGRVIRNQITKSGTSIGANYREANRARSKADFKNKIKICESEASLPNGIRSIFLRGETQYWIEVILDTKWLSREEANTDYESAANYLHFSQLLEQSRPLTLAHFRHFMSHQPSTMTHSKLKIAVLGTRGFPNIQGGVEKHCEELYPRLADGNCEVTVFTRKSYVNPKIHTYKGVNLIPLSCPKNKFLEAFLHTFIGIVVIRKFSPDILHIHAIGPSLFIPLARLLGLKVVMTHHGPDYKRKKWGKLAKFVLKLGERSGCKWANDIITVSGTISNHIKEKYKRDVTVIPNGVTIPEILQSNNSLKEYGLDKGKYLLSVGRFVPEKGFHDLIDSFNQLLTYNSKSQNSNNQFPAQDWKLVIVGDSDHEDKYSLRLKEKAYGTKNIIMTGLLTGEPLHELYSHAGLFVLPSYYEGLPIVLLEAMSYGLSCIASDIPANKDVDLLAEDRYFKAGDINGLAKKINEFVVKPLSEEEKRIQLNGINEKYNWDRIAQKTMKVYESIL